MQIANHYQTHTHTHTHTQTNTETHRNTRKNTVSERKLSTTVNQIFSVISTNKHQKKIGLIQTPRKPKFSVSV